MFCSEELFSNLQHSKFCLLSATPLIISQNLMMLWIAWNL